MKKLLLMTAIALCSTASFAQSLPDPVWKWSAELEAHYYRDNDGRVHYSDGSVSGPNQVWWENGKAVYSANSAGPADKTGQHAIQAERISDNVPPVPPKPAPGTGCTFDPSGAVAGPSNCNKYNPNKGGGASAGQSGSPLKTFMH